MTLQARLTVWSILVMAFIVGVVTASDLIGELDTQFTNALERANQANSFALVLVNRAVLDHPKPTTAESLASDVPRLSADLSQIALRAGSVVEIAICDLNDRILADSLKSAIGSQYQPNQPLRPLVKESMWWHKIWVLLRGEHSYEVSQTLNDLKSNAPKLKSYVVLDPGLIQRSIAPTVRQHALISLLSIGGAIFGAFVFSTIAFRPLGRLGKMLDMMTQGEYELQPTAESGKADRRTDEFGQVASKVSLLGQQLRGAQSEILDLKGNFERLLEELEDAVLIFGRDRRLLAAAGGVERFLRRPRGEMIARPLADIFPPNTSMGLLLAQATQTNRPVRNRPVPLSTEGGHGHGLQIALLTVEFLGENGAAGPGGGMLIRLRDPEATRQIGKQLQTADRLSAISRLTGGVAHEVKNPLNAILMHVELARMKLAHGDYDIGQQMEVISSEILRLDRVVKTFLDFTKPVKLNVTAVQLDQFLSDIVELATPQAAASNVQIAAHNVPAGVTLSVDADLLKQAVLNIVVNAIEAMPEGGTLKFEAADKGDVAEILISDSGSGVPADVREKIYNLYFTTKEHGSGIGLAMTFRIVQLHDGTIDFTSEPGKGTTFSLRFPTTVLAA